MNVPQFIYGSNDDLQRYFALLVQYMQVNLSNNGFVLPSHTTAQVTDITNSTFLPVLPAGTQWFNSDLKKMQFITNQAIPASLPGGPANATIETVTST